MPTELKHTHKAKTDKLYLRSMNDRWAFVLPDVLFYHRLAVNDLLVTDCVTLPLDLFI